MRNRPTTIRFIRGEYVVMQGAQLIIATAHLTEAVNAAGNGDIQCDDATTIARAEHTVRMRASVAALRLYSALTHGTRDDRLTEYNQARAACVRLTRATNPATTDDTK